MTPKQRNVLEQLSKIIVAVTESDIKVSYRDGFFRVKDKDGAWSLIDWDGIDDDVWPRID